MNRFKSALACLVFLCFTLPALSQKLKGKIIAESGRGASSVTLKFSNSANSIKTNTDGTFEILASNLPDTLILSGTGFEPYKVLVTEKDLKDPDFEVVLLNKRRNLDEVVVTAYAGAKKSERSFDHDLSGAVPGISYSPAAPAGAGDTRYFSTTTTDRIIRNVETGGRKLRLQDTNLFKKTPLYANILTAGEVNDFNKWKMWEDFTADQFAEHSKRWILHPRQRYTVQLQYTGHSAAVGETVQLVDASGKVIWTAITDNTGKAELWGTINGTENTGALRIVYGNKEELRNPVSFENGVNSITLHKACSVSDKVDIAFVVDATGSMGDEIEFLKLELEEVIRKTFEDYKNLDLQVGSVFYRDQSDEYLTRKVDFQTELLKVLNFVKLQRAGGGGDYPEAVHSALSVALDSMQWRPEARSRILFLLLDAPPHDEQKEEIIRLTQKAAAMGIRIVPLACSGTDKATEYVLRSIALATNGTYLFLTDNSGVGLPHIKPTTDTYQVELLNSLLQRIIKQMITVNDCATMTREQPVFNMPENIEKVKIYPNPSSGTITIESKNLLKEIFIADFSGKILQRIPVPEKQNRIQVNLGNYANGTYLLKYITKENTWGAEKIVLIR